MNFDLSEEQLAIRDLAAKLFADFATDERIAQLSASGVAFDVTLWSALQQSGLTALLAPSECGGGGLAMLEAMLVLEQQGRRLSPAPLWRQLLASAAMAHFGAGALKSTWLERLIEGDALATIDVEACAAGRRARLRAEPIAGGWKLSGRVTAMPLARQSQLALLPADAPDGLRVFAIEVDSLEATWLEGVLTHGEPAADLVLRELVVPSTSMLEPLAAEWLAPRTIAALASLQLGVAQEALRRAVGHICERRQFDRPLAAFQALSQKTADCFIDIEALRSTLLQLCWRLDAGRDATLEAHVVKCWACDCGHRVTHAAQHMHGGLGADVSHPIHRFTLWSRALEVSLGGVSEHVHNIGRRLAEAQAAGA